MPVFVYYVCKGNKIRNNNLTSSWLNWLSRLAETSLCKLGETNSLWDVSTSQDFGDNERAHLQPTPVERGLANNPDNNFLNFRILSISTGEMKSFFSPFG